MRGLTELKLQELLIHMRYCDIDILCIQETWTKSAEVYEEQGFLIILSGSELHCRTFTGVGFIFSPRIRKHIHSYKQVTDRLAFVNIFLQGGVLSIFSAYAPHNQRPLDEKIDFYRNLDVEYDSCSANLGKIVLGDLNSRLGLQKAGEGHSVGPYGFGTEARQRINVCYRDLLIEFCDSSGLLVANTFVQGAPSEKVTYMSPGTRPMDEITDSAFG